MRTLSDLGISIRAGVHTGEVELTSSGISGIAVHALPRWPGHLRSWCLRP
jgi:hypothetical protein